jgi:hypothetical protein
MTGYQFLRFLHVLGAIGWVGAAMAFLALGRAQVAAGDYRGMWSVVRRSDAIGKLIFIPAGLLTVGSGIAMVATQPAFRFTDLWILLGIAGIVLSGVVQGVIAAPSVKNFETLAEEHGTDGTELHQPASRMNMAAALDTGLLLLVVGVMVFRPGF